MEKGHSVSRNVKLIFTNKDEEQTWNNDKKSITDSVSSLQLPKCSSTDYNITASGTKSFKRSFRNTEVPKLKQDVIYLVSATVNLMKLFNNIDALEPISSK